MDVDRIPGAVPEEVIRPRPFDIKAKSVPSELHAYKNEDAIFQIPEKRAFGVFDGMGGHSAGDMAAGSARDSIEGSLRALKDSLTIEEAQEAVRKALLDASDSVYNRAQVEHSDMGTTASVVYVWEVSKGERKAVVGNVGDSRVYLFRDGKLEQITLDDSTMSASLQNDQKARELQEKMNNVINPKKELSTEEQDRFRARNVLSQFLGKETIEPRIHTLDLLPTDILIACSDGISDNLTHDEINNILVANLDNAQAVIKLIEAARTRSRERNHFRAKADDMSVIVAGDRNLAAPQKGKVKPAEPAVEAIDVEILREGSTVNVKRSSGAIDPGWTIDKFDPEKGYVTVTKKEGNDYLKKQVTRDELEFLNNKVLITDIDKVSTVGELSAYLSIIKGLQGSKKFYYSDELRSIVNEVLEGRAPLEQITRAGGLRQKVEDLLKMQKIR